MMWYLQLFIEWANAMLAQDVVINAIFAFIALLAVFGLSPRICAALTLLVHVILLMS